MSQDAGDYNVANAAGSVVRGDMNDILGDIKTLNAGTSEPSGILNWQLWADSSSNEINIRYSGAWKTLPIDPTTNTGLVDNTTVDGNLLLLSGGGMQASQTYLDNNSASAETLEAHQRNSAGTVAWLIGDNTAFAGKVLKLSSDEEDTGSFHFLHCTSDYDGSETTEVEILEDGEIKAKAFTPDGSDYAEAFEWVDGNPDAEDRVGLSVVIEGDMIRLPVEGEEPDGVTSANPAMCANSAGRRWAKKFRLDPFGRRLGGRETINPDYRPSTNPEIPRQIEVDGGLVFIEKKGKLHKVIDRDERGRPVGPPKRHPRKMVKNPNWSPDQDYKPRLSRPEWSAVGLIGRLPLRKGQPVGARWKKQKDITDAVELWLVR